MSSFLSSELKWLYFSQDQVKEDILFLLFSFVVLSILNQITIFPGAFSKLSYSSSGDAACPLFVSPYCILWNVPMSLSVLTQSISYKMTELCLLLVVLLPHNFLGTEGLFKKYLLNCCWTLWKFRASHVGWKLIFESWNERSVLFCTRDILLTNT